MQKIKSEDILEKTEWDSVIHTSQWYRVISSINDVNVWLRMHGKFLKWEIYYQKHYSKHEVYTLFLYFDMVSRAWWRLTSNITWMDSTVFSENHNQNPPSTVNTSILNSASHIDTIKITIKNYLLLKAQIVPFLKGNQLFHLVDVLWLEDEQVEERGS